ncbi:MAG: hypothetical protein K0Q49_1030 [Haloplasmataceae bacterium]|jgi:hypothetical protein|nr:hypothetical protein [Haloplasmataceae bacterium]
MNLLDNFYVLKVLNGGKIRQKMVYLYIEKNQYSIIDFFFIVIFIMRGILIRE